eukprot:gnl/Dysnectes_brevis/1131_a1263_1600.p1 GENE.gnl/Dysnectes_brevis/1131_a1263_1600~~gnl/Dysnectes_brevis/1131_a1263_1600.p1  ORF type:complete len:1088 (+),score=303.87 gnl/Dysnectes_brevis/1131_a1263_1600:22-3264(+)
MSDSDYSYSDEANEFVLVLFYQGQRYQLSIDNSLLTLSLKKLKRKALKCFKNEHRSRKLFEDLSSRECDLYVSFSISSSLLHNQKDRIENLPWGKFLVAPLELLDQPVTILLSSEAGPGQLMLVPQRDAPDEAPIPPTHASTPSTAVSATRPKDKSLSQLIEGVTDYDKPYVGTISSYIAQTLERSPSLAMVPSTRIGAAVVSAGLPKHKNRLTSLLINMSSYGFGEFKNRPGKGSMFEVLTAPEVREYGYDDVISFYAAVCAAIGSAEPRATPKSAVTLPFELSQSQKLAVSMVTSTATRTELPYLHSFMQLASRKVRKAEESFETGVVTVTGSDLGQQVRYYRLKKYEPSISCLLTRIVDMKLANTGASKHSVELFKDMVGDLNWYECVLVAIRNWGVFKKRQIVVDYSRLIAKKKEALKKQDQAFEYAQSNLLDFDTHSHQPLSQPEAVISLEPTPTPLNLLAIDPLPADPLPMHGFMLPPAEPLAFMDIFNQDPRIQPLDQLSSIFTQNPEPSVKEPSAKEPSAKEPSVHEPSDAISLVDTSAKEPDTSADYILTGVVRHHLILVPKKDLEFISDPDAPEPELVSIAFISWMDNDQSRIAIWEDAPLPDLEEVSTRFPAAVDRCGLIPFCQEKARFLTEDGLAATRIGPRPLDLSTRQVRFSLLPDGVRVKAVRLESWVGCSSGQRLRGHITSLARDTAFAISTAGFHFCFPRDKQEYHIGDLVEFSADTSTLSEFDEDLLPVAGDLPAGEWDHDQQDRAFRASPDSVDVLGSLFRDPGSFPVPVAAYILRPFRGELTFAVTVPGPGSNYFDVAVGFSPDPTLKGHGFVLLNPRRPSISVDGTPPFLSRHTTGGAIPISLLHFTVACKYKDSVRGEVDLATGSMKLKDFQMMSRFPAVRPITAVPMHTLPQALHGGDTARVTTHVGATRTRGDVVLSAVVVGVEYASLGVTGHLSSELHVEGHDPVTADGMGTGLLFGRIRRLPFAADMAGHVESDTPASKWVRVYIPWALERRLGLKAGHIIRPKSGALRLAIWRCNLADSEDDPIPGWFTNGSGHVLVLVTAGRKSVIVPEGCE